MTIDARLGPASAPGEQRGRSFLGVFIRVPLVEALGGGVDVLARLNDGAIVAVQQGSLLATPFHPELTDGRRVHRYFLSLIKERAAGARGDEG